MNLNPIKVIKTYFSSRKEKKLLKVEREKLGFEKWMQKLYALGFKDISFPILIIYDEWRGIELTLVDDLEEFAFTNSIHYWPLDSDARLLDINGNLWSWKYDNINKTNLPGIFKVKLTLEDVKKIVREGIIGQKLENEIKIIINNANTIRELFNRLDKDVHLC